MNKKEKLSLGAMIVVIIMVLTLLAFVTAQIIITQKFLAGALFFFLLGITYTWMWIFEQLLRLVLYFMKKKNDQLEKEIERLDKQINMLDDDV